MAITIPTVAAGRVLWVTQTDTSGGTVTSPSLTSLTKNSGDLLIAIVITYDGNSTNAEFSSWGGSFTEFVDQATTSTMGIGAAYKWSTGSETGTFTVAVAGGAAGSDAAFCLLSIPGAHDTTAPEGGTIANGTSAAADPGSLNPAGWGAEESLWIAVAGSGETSTTGSYTGIASAPTNYTDYSDSGISADVVGGVEGAVAFRLLNAASEDVGAFSVDTSNARNSALLIAVRPGVVNLTATGAISVPMATVAGTGAEEFTATGAIAVPSATVAGAGAEVFTATGAVAVPTATVAGTGDHTLAEPTGTGAISVPTATVSGVGELIFTATGALAVPASAVAGLGSEVFTGTGAVAVPAATVSGTGLHAQAVTGTGAIEVPAALVEGSGSGGVVADGGGRSLSLTGRRRRTQRKSALVDDDEWIVMV